MYFKFDSILWYKKSLNNKFKYNQKTLGTYILTTTYTKYTCNAGITAAADIKTSPLLFNT